MRRWLRRILGALLVLLMAVAGSIVVVAGSDWGRERARSLLLGILRERVDGSVRIARIEGNLLRGVVLEEVAISGPAGDPLLTADRIGVRYSLLPLLRGRIVLSEVEVLRPEIILDRRHGGEWNFVRAFPRDTAAAPDTAGGGFGSRIQVDDLSIRDGRVVARTPWRPLALRPGSVSAGAAGGARDSAAAGASRRARPRLRPVEGGHQVVREVRALDARLSDLVYGEPRPGDVSGRLASLSAVARPFRSPPLVVRDLSGRFSLSDDSARVGDVRLELEDSRLAAEGTWARSTGAVRGRLRADPLAVADLRWVDPTLPEEGRIELEMEASGTREALRVAVSGLDARLEDARVRGRLDVWTGAAFPIRAMDVRFAGVRARLVERLARRALPVEGSAEGRVALAPAGDVLRLDGEIVFVEAADGGRSRITAEGELDPRGVASPRDTRLRAVRLRLDPVRLGLLRSVRPGPGLDGTLTGTATLDGSLDSGLETELDLTHRGTTGLSRLLGEVRFAATAPARFDASLRAPTLSLATVGRFAPAAGLRGRATADLEARGTTDDLALRLGLTVEEGGTLTVAGTAGLADSRERYDLALGLEEFDARRASSRVPATQLTGTVTVRGEGTEPATLRAALRADVAGEVRDRGGVDRARLRARIAEGVATVEVGEIEVASASARLEGDLGLVAGRSGELRYLVRVDSLSDFAGRFPPDTSAPRSIRPAVQARRIAIARQDSLRRARETEVERAATGWPREPELRPDTVDVLPPDSLAGSARLAGAVSGNLERLDVRGEAELRDVVARGSRLAEGRLSFGLRDVRSARPTATLEAGVDSLRVAGYAFDSVGVRLEHAGKTDEGEGSVEVVIGQDPDRDYLLRAGYRLDLEGRELRLEEVALRFDTVRWSSTAPGTLRWGEAGLEVEGVELRSGTGGRIHADGRLASGDHAGGTGPDSLVLEVADLELGHVVGLLQDTLDVGGRLSLRVAVEGTRADPRLRARAALTDPALEGTPLPSLGLEAAYADAVLRGRVALLGHAKAGPPRAAAPRSVTGEREAPATAGGPSAAGDTLLTAEGTLGLDLADRGRDPTGAEADRSLSLVIRVDSLPLEALPRFTDAVSDVRGRLRGRVSVEGTLGEPEVDGVVDLDLASLDIVRPGLELREVAGTLRLRGDSIVLDSLAARSGGGSIRIAGVVETGRPRAPAVDLALEATDAVVLDNELGQGVRIRGDLTARGPYDSLLVEGELEVQEGVFYVPESRSEVVDLEAPAAAQAIRASDVDQEALPERNPLLRGLRADVAVRVSRNNWARSPDGAVEIYTPEDGEPLVVRYDARRRVPVLSGVIHTDQGEYGFAGRRFALTTGTVTFLGTPELDPLLQLTALHEVQRGGRPPLNIQINVGGRLREPVVTLESDAQPPLSQTDLISFLVFGTPSSSLLQQGGGGLAGSSGSEGLGALATQKLAGLALGSLVDQAFSSLEGSATRSGLDVFRLSPADLPEELAFDDYFQNVVRGTEIEAGKYVTRRLFIAAQGRPTTEAFPGLRMEYRTPSGFRWTVAWEPRFLPSLPSFDLDRAAEQQRVLGSFLFWERRF